jgi:AcrR family transcriptional regulator
LTNNTRAYDSRGRQAQADRSRNATLDIARTLFLANGYAATTMASIAADAGVAVDTVHKAFGGKVGLARAIFERGLAGEGMIPAPQRSDDMQNVERDPRALVHRWGMFSTEVAPLVAPIYLLIREAAAVDPDMATLLADSQQERRQRMRHNAHTLAERGHLREGVTLESATDVLWTYSSPELYELLVMQCGWDSTRYGRFLGDALAAALLDLGDRPERRGGDVDGPPGVRCAEPREQT